MVAAGVGPAAVAVVVGLDRVESLSTHMGFTPRYPPDRVLDTTGHGPDGCVVGCLRGV